MRKAYPTDLTDAQWKLVEPLLPPAQSGGRPREVDLREIVNTILYIARAGCQWDMIPNDLMPRSTVHGYFSGWKEDGTWQKVLDRLREKVRVQESHDPTPSIACIDSQSVKSTEVGGLGEEDKAGYDGGKKVKGRKRHILVDKLGLLLLVTVTAANFDDGTHAPDVLAKIDAATLPRLKVVYADQKYNNKTLDAWMEENGVAYEIEVRMKPDDAPKGFVPVRKRWVVEQSIACLNRSRRLSRDFERTTEASEAWVMVSGIQRLLKRAAPDKAKKIAEFRYPKKVKSEQEVA